MSAERYPLFFEQTKPQTPFYKPCSYLRLISYHEVVNLEDIKAETPFVHPAVIGMIESGDVVGQHGLWGGERIWRHDSMAAFRDV